MATGPASTRIGTRSVTAVDHCAGRRTRGRSADRVATGSAVTSTSAAATTKAGHGRPGRAARARRGCVIVGHRVTAIPCNGTCQTVCRPVRIRDREQTRVAALACGVGCISRPRTCAAGHRILLDRAATATETIGSRGSGTGTCCRPVGGVATGRATVTAVVLRQARGSVHIAGRLGDVRASRGLIANALRARSRTRGTSGCHSARAIAARTNATGPVTATSATASSVATRTEGTCAIAARADCARTNATGARITVICVSATIAGISMTSIQSNQTILLIQSCQSCVNLTRVTTGTRAASSGTASSSCTITAAARSGCTVAVAAGTATAVTVATGATCTCAIPGIRIGRTASQASCKPKAQIAGVCVIGLGLAASGVDRDTIGVGITVATICTVCVRVIGPLTSTQRTSMRYVISAAGQTAVLGTRETQAQAQADGSRITAFSGYAGAIGNRSAAVMRGRVTDSLTTCACTAAAVGFRTRQAHAQTDIRRITRVTTVTTDTGTIGITGVTTQCVCIAASRIARGIPRMGAATLPRIAAVGMRADALIGCR